MKWYPYVELMVFLVSLDALNEAVKALGSRLHWTASFVLEILVS
jgi:hypothetical protein